MQQINTSTYPDGVPNPFVPRVHAWGGGPWPSEGTRYHGPVYTRPMWAGTFQGRPMNGLGVEVTGQETANMSAAERYEYYTDQCGQKQVAFIQAQEANSPDAMELEKNYWQCERTRQVLGMYILMVRVGVGAGIAGLVVGAGGALLAQYLLRK